MALFAVDSNGQRIKTDILVCGYVRNIMDEYKIEIPDEIIGLCFLFWFIQVCDEWDEALYDEERIEIDGLCGKWHGYASLFGSKIVESGTFKWSLKLKSQITWGCIGIIKNDKSIIEESKWSNNYGFIEGCGCFLFFCNERSNGALWIDDIKNQDYCRNLCCDPGTIIEMTLNMDKKTIKYKVGDVECKAVGLESLSEQIGYRLAVTIVKEGDETIVIELV